MMNTFFKTFIICLIAALGFLFYQYVSTDSYSGLKLSSNNPIFGLHSTKAENQNVNVPIEPQEMQTPKNNENKQNVQKTNNAVYYSKVYFFNKSGKLDVVKRKYNEQITLNKAVNILLRGPIISETKNGYYSEIPPNVDLISVKNQGKNIIVNLSSNFGNGGGTQSIENRVLQLSKTIKLYEPNKNVYLYIDGQQVEYLGGDGVYIKQPLD